MRELYCTEALKLTLVRILIMHHRPNWQHEDMFNLNQTLLSISLSSPDYPIWFYFYLDNGTEWPIFTARCYASAVYAVMRCLYVRLSVRLSVTFVDHVKTNKNIFEILSPPGSHTILVFPHQRGADNPTGIPLTGVSNARGVWKKYRFSTIIFTNISLYLRNDYS